MDNPLAELCMFSSAVTDDYLTAYPDLDEGYDGYIFVGAFDRVDLGGDHIIVGSHLTPAQAQVFADALWDMAQAMIDAG